MLGNRLFRVCRDVLAKTSSAAGLQVPRVPIIGTRFINIANIDAPKPDNGRDYKMIVHYPEDGKYTTKHLPVTRLGGRDPETGRVVQGRWGGGLKSKYRWIDFDRNGPTEREQYKEELVIEVQFDPNRTAFIALVGCGAHQRYIIATTDMKAGKVIRANNYIPDIPGRGVVGDSYALGALGNGTMVCCVEKFPGMGSHYLKDGGQTGKITRRTTTGKVVVRLTERHEVALEPTCCAVVGQVSNEDGSKVHVGSAMRLRWLGYRGRSGLHQRKQGYHGRKIKNAAPLYTPSKDTATRNEICITSFTEGRQKRLIPKTDRVS